MCFQKEMFCRKQNSMVRCLYKKCFVPHWESKHELFLHNLIPYLCTGGVSLISIITAAVCNRHQKSVQTSDCWAEERATCGAPAASTQWKWDYLAGSIFKARGRSKTPAIPEAFFQDCCYSASGFRRPCVSAHFFFLLCTLFAFSLKAVISFF